MESTWKNMGTNLSSKPMIGDTMVIDFNCNDNMHVTFIMKSLFGLWFNAIFFDLPTCLFYKYCSCISIWGDLTLRVIMVIATLFNKSQCKYA